MAKKKPAPKRGASRYQVLAAGNGVPGWVWLVAGLVIGSFLMFLMKLEPGRKEVQREKPETQHSAALQDKQQQRATQQIKPKYEFYTLLPESEVVVPSEAVPEKAPPPTSTELAKADEARAKAALAGQEPPPLSKVLASAGTQFFLQAGSFRKQADADRVRAQLILLGQSVNIESGTVRDETWYRVMVGPFDNRDQLSQAQKILSSNGFSNLLLQQRKVH